MIQRRKDGIVGDGEVNLPPKPETIYKVKLNSSDLFIEQLGRACPFLFFLIPYHDKLKSR